MVFDVGEIRVKRPQRLLVNMLYACVHISCGCEHTAYFGKSIRKWDTEERKRAKRPVAIRTNQE